MNENYVIHSESSTRGGAFSIVALLSTSGFTEVVTPDAPAHNGWFCTVGPRRTAHRPVARNRRSALQAEIQHRSVHLALFREVRVPQPDSYSSIA